MRKLLGMDNENETPEIDPICAALSDLGRFLEEHVDHPLKEARASEKEYLAAVALDEQPQTLSVADAECCIKCFTTRPYFLRQRGRHTRQPPYGPGSFWRDRHFRRRFRCRLHSSRDYFAISLSEGKAQQNFF